MSRTVLQVFRATTLICPPLFFILATEKERLTAMKQWCRHRSNQVTAMETQGGPANKGPGPGNKGPGPTNNDPGHLDQVESAAGQTSRERKDRGGSPSRAGAEHRGQEGGLEPSLVAGRLETIKQWFRLKPKQVMEMEGGPLNDGSGPEHDVIVSHVTGPCDQAGAAAGQSCGERRERGGVRHRGRELGLDSSLLPNYVTTEGD